MTWSELEEIHNKMETEIGNNGVYLDAIYFCPHHPHKGYDGEVVELKIDWIVVNQSQECCLKWLNNIDLSKSWMIGDGENDVKAGIAAGCRTVFIRNPENCDVENYGQDYTYESVYEFLEENLTDF